MSSELYKSIPLTLSGTDVAQVPSATEEGYWSQEAAINWVSSYDSDGAQFYGNVQASASGSTIGSFVDTFYQQPVGTHPGTSLSVGSTTTLLFMMDSTGPDFNEVPELPLLASDSSGDIYEMDSASGIKLGIRLAEEVHSNEMHGSFRIGATQPSADYVEWDAAVFSDTLATGSVPYSIWRKNAFAAGSSATDHTNETPASFLLRLKDSDAPDIQEMDATECRSTLTTLLLAGMEASGVGSYQLRSSAQGAPTDSGTWVARGTAIDTRNTTQDLQYTSQQYTTPQFTRQYTGQYTTQFTGQSFADVPTQFAGIRQVAFSGNRAYTNQYAGSRNYAGPYSGERNYADQYTSAATNFSGTRQFAGDRNYAGQYTGGTEFFTGIVSGQFAGNRQFTGQRQFTRYFQTNYAGARGGYFPYSGSYAGTVYYPYTAIYFRPVGFNSSATFTGSTTYTGYTPGNPVPGNTNSGSSGAPFYQVTTPFGPVPVPTYYSASTNPPSTNPPTTNTSTSPNSRTEYYSSIGYETQYFSGANAGTAYFAGSRNGIAYFSGNYLGPASAQYTGERHFTGAGQFAGTRSAEYSGTRQYAGDRNYGGQYTSASTNFSGTRQFAGERAFSDNYSGDRNYVGQYAGSRQYAGNFIGPQAGQFTGLVATTYTGQYTTQFSGQFSSNYTSQYSAQYTGTTLVALSTTIETYTLYCKISES
jgi:hypothetical protein